MALGATCQVKGVETGASGFCLPDGAELTSEVKVGGGGV